MPSASVFLGGYMKVAVIDIGTNSVRMLKGIIESDVLSIGNKKIITTRIGEGMGQFVNGQRLLQTDAMARTADAVALFSEDLKKWACEEIHVIATSAVRDADNKQDFLRMVDNKAHLQVDVISGDMEAKLGFLGVMMGIDSTDVFMVLDVGGGSTEIIIGSADRGILFSKSIDIGAVRMMSKYGENGKFSSSSKKELLAFINCQIDDYIQSVQSADMAHLFDISSISHLIGIGGTATTFGTIDLQMSQYDRQLIQSHEISIDKLVDIQRYMENLSTEDRKHVVGLQPKRADIILAGGEIILSVMQRFQFKNMMISDYDNLEGLLANKYGDKFSNVIISDVD